MAGGLGFYAARKGLGEMYNGNIEGSTSCMVGTYQCGDSSTAQIVFAHVHIFLSAGFKPIAYFD